MADVHIHTSYNVHIHYQLAGIGERIIANLIDLLFKALYYFSVLFVFYFLNLESAYGLIFLMLLPVLIYSPVCEILLQGQTPGMRLRNIKVISLTEKEATIGQYLIRWIFRLIDISVAMGSVALISIAASPKGQRLGDMAAGTTVIKLKNKVSQEDVSALYESDYNEGVYFPEAAQLSDQEIATIRDVLASNQSALIHALAAKVKTRLSVQTNMEAQRFLSLILNDAVRSHTDQNFR